MKKTILALTLALCLAAVPLLAAGETKPPAPAGAPIPVATDDNTQLTPSGSTTPPSATTDQDSAPVVPEPAK